VLRLIWQESGGPPVKQPTEKGFGCFVLDRVTVNALGEGGQQFKPEGLVWTCIIKSEHLVDASNPMMQEPRAIAAQAPSVH
jgi:two-component sensor histidine kinase